MQENHQQQTQQPAAAAQQGAFAAKQPAAASPTAFTAAGTAARRPPGSRRKGMHPTRSSTGVGTRSRQGSQEHEAAPPLAAAGPAAPGPAAVAPVQAQAASGAAAGSGELDAQAKTAYTTSEMYRSQVDRSCWDQLGSRSASLMWSCMAPAAGVDLAWLLAVASCLLGPPLLPNRAWLSSSFAAGQRGIPGQRLHHRLRAVHQGGC